ncbi:ABC transporter permease [Kaistia algarum]|uniref:ABC transporter permease n=1 Tax=Kaistia algarum TaxID=2083279 RepID=UPI000CE819CC|nr:ABC transporter permease [Kaistia algarum]MCX5515767.1 ABC transporter permease [Kaistia algarum]PPE80857.1 ABC transporter permease [Kaistia algarum]
MKRLLKIYLEKPELAGVLLLLILICVFQFLSHGIFLSLQNLRGILGLLPEVGMVTIGFALLMICGEFDLSVGSVFALMPMSVALMLNADMPFWAAMAIGLAICAGIGFLNGFITLTFAIPSFITTLGMLFIARSLTVVISGGFPPLLAVDKIPASLFTAFIGDGLLRASFVWFVAIAVFASVLLTMTNLGNWIKSTGGFLEAAMSMGIPVRSVKLACFILCSMLAGFAGTVQVFRLQSPLPSIGESLELQAVAAAVIGGVALTGGVGTVFGAIVGALLIRVIDNGLVLSRIDANWFKFAIGTLTILAVIGNSWLRRTARQIRLEQRP